jgi:hypothetical protein
VVGLLVGYSIEEVGVMTGPDASFVHAFYYGVR